MSDRKPSFMSLATELRSEIYSYLLPQGEFHPFDPRRKVHVAERSRRRPQKYHAAFMAACKQTYEEAAQLLYGANNSFFVVVENEEHGENTWLIPSIEDRPQNHSAAVLSFLDQRITLRSKPRNYQKYFQSLTRIRRLRLVVNARSWSPQYMCDTQDLICKFLGPLFDESHQLIDFTAYVNSDAKYTFPKICFTKSLDELDHEWFQNDLAPLNYPASSLTFRSGNFRSSRFLVEPLEMLRMSPQANATVHFRVRLRESFPQPWHSVSSVGLHTLVCGNTTPSSPLLRLSLSGYFDLMRSMFRLLYRSGRVVLARLFYVLMENLCEDRLEGSVSQFCSDHQYLILTANDTARDLNDAELAGKLRNLATRMDTALTVSTQVQSNDVGNKRPHDESQEDVVEEDVAEGEGADNDHHRAVKKPRLS